MPARLDSGRRTAAEPGRPAPIGTRLRRRTGPGSLPGSSAAQQAVAPHSGRCPCGPGTPAEPQDHARRPPRTTSAIPSAPAASDRPAHEPAQTPCPDPRRTAVAPRCRRWRPAPPESPPACMPGEAAPVVARHKRAHRQTAVTSQCLPNTSTCRGRARYRPQSSSGMRLRLASRQHMVVGKRTPQCHRDDYSARTAGEPRPRPSAPGCIRGVAANRAGLEYLQAWAGVTRPGNHGPGSGVEAGRGPRCRREPSEWVEAGLEQAELVAFGVGEDVPLLLAGLADVGRACPELQEAFEFGVLIAVGGIDVDVQPGLPLLRLVPATEDDRRLRAAEPFARPDLDAVLLAIEHYEVQDLAPERRQHLRVAATEHELTDTACH